MDAPTETLPLSPLKMQYNQAGEGLKAELNKLPLSAEDGRSLALEKIEIGKGSDTIEGSWASRVSSEGVDKPVNLVLKLKGDTIQENEGAVATAVLNYIKKNVKTLADNVEFDSREAHAEKMMNQLLKFQAAGADIPYDVKKFRLFDKEVMAASSWAIDDNGLNIRKDKDGLGTRVIVNIAEKPGATPDSIDPANKEVLESLKANEEKWKLKAIERIEYHSPNMDAKEKEEMKAQIMASKLDFTQKDNSNFIGSNRVEFTIRSKEQAEAYEKFKPSEPMNDADKAKLEATNPLNKLTEAQAAKVVGYTTFHYSAEADKIFPLIAGRMDIARTVGEKLAAFEESIKTTNPELAAEVKKFREDDDLKQHDTWRMPPKEREKLKLKTPPVVVKDADPNKFGEMTITFRLDGKDANAAIKEMVELGKDKTAAQIGSDIIATLPEQLHQTRLNEQSASTGASRVA